MVVMFDDTHVVKFSEEGFTIQHPLAEREEMLLFDCNLHKYLTEFEEMPVDHPGLYSIDWLDGEWAWTTLKVDL